MGQIALLDPLVAQQVAAGEVVDRPASVVKELLENALDAGATRIEVEISDGGRERMLVRDDGSGMSEEDAKLSVLRHATSKIRTATDIESVVTLGFRGEALPSIASVSAFSLTTSTGEGAGTVPVHRPELLLNGAYRGVEGGLRGHRGAPRDASVGWGRWRSWEDRRGLLRRGGCLG